MLEIERVRGIYQGRNAGTKYNGFAWAVATDQSHSATMYEQTKVSLAEIDRVLGELGTSRERLINCTVYVGNMQLKDEMERAWLEWIGDNPAHWPQRACVEARLKGLTQVEFVVIAACP
ncbi:MAG: Rid family hydrolase [Pseudomonadota bacterium]